MTAFKNLCFIPAKAASTRLPKKNILEIKGKPLVYYPIKAAYDSGLFDKEDIIVSTESTEIKAIAESHGARVPYLRDVKLAKDPFGVVDVALDFLERFVSYQKYDRIFFLLPTAPFTMGQDIVKANEIFQQKKGLEALMSVTQTEHNALRSFFIKNNSLAPLHKECVNKKSQELEATYRINGAIIICDIKAFLAKKTYFMYPLGCYPMPQERSIDIDTAFDFKMAQYLSDSLLPQKDSDR